MKNVLKLSILPIESVFIIEFHVGLKVKNPDIFYLEKKKRNIDTEWAYHSEFYFVVFFLNWGPGLNSFDSTYIYFLIYSLLNMWHLDPITFFDVLIAYLSYLLI